VLVIIGVESATRGPASTRTARTPALDKKPGELFARTPRQVQAPAPHPSNEGLESLVVVERRFTGQFTFG
jgi:hypothetical protein